ncbi:MAG: NADH-quinone oxidoreductase subunit H [Candidatus Omnitrophica bacterium]|jgi:formate hydrogenlyase subunit 4|nr:NADH-quinone oxidoreductase subunit H [Candidatus Omnitrophota bacterium]
MEILFFFLQIIILIVISPFLSGIMRKLKNSLHMRKGSPVLQPYYNMFKYFAKEEVIPQHASVIFRASPYIVLASVVTAFLFVPVFHFSCGISAIGGVLALFFFLSLGRFFLVLAGLDTGSSFGGMGSSRDMFISSLAEPVAISAIAVVGLKSGSLNLPSALSLVNTPVSILVASVSLLLVVIAETSRIPVDNQETHLELTMIHEAMLLEYSGRSLAILELSAHIKQMLFFSVLASILWPFPVSLQDPLQVYLVSAVWFMGKIFCIGFAISVLEIMLAKMRLFRAVDFLGFSFLLSILALVMARLGV